MIEFFAFIRLIITEASIMIKTSNIEVVTIILVGAMMTVYANDETRALSFIQGNLKADGPYTTELLSGGLSGSTLIKINTAENIFVVRFWNMEWVEDFPQDLACQLIASDAGYGPLVFFTDEAACITVIEYIQPEVFPETKIRFQGLVQLLKKIHSGPAVPQGIDKASYIEESIDTVSKLNLPFLDINAIRAIKEAVYKATQQNTRSAACHRDLHPGNLIYNQGRFVAIDYTWGGMDDPFIDLATLAIFNCTTFEEEQLLLQLYLGDAPSSEDIARLSLVKLAAKIFYGLEFLKLTPVSALNSTISEATKSYMNFGGHGTPQNPSDFLEYAISLLSEVVEYSRTEQYSKDLILIQNAPKINLRPPIEF